MSTLDELNEAVQKFVKETAHDPERLITTNWVLGIEKIRANDNPDPDVQDLTYEFGYASSLGMSASSIVGIAHATIDLINRSIQ